MRIKDTSYEIEHDDGMTSHLPVVAIVGRPNVGKSTLFNRIIQRRKAVVLKMPGVTRDRNYQQVEWFDRRFLLIDTGGYDPENTETIWSLVREQTQMAIDEADVIMFVTEVSHTLHPNDEMIMQMLRVIKKPVFIVVNKCDNPSREQEAYEFMKLGVDRIYPISAEHNLHIDELMADVIEALPLSQTLPQEVESIRVAIVGKPNVGKSTLVNALLGEKRTIVSEIPGTTRDSVDTLIKRGDQWYTFIDTAGIKRRGRNKEIIEKITVSASIMSLERSDIALVVCDATEGITNQDQHVAGYALEAGRGIIIIINKWDLIQQDRETFALWQQHISSVFKFIDFAPVIYVSAKNGKRVKNIYDLIKIVYREHSKRIDTSDLNNALEEIFERQEPPHYKGTPLKIKYVTQVSIQPPTFVFFTNFPETIHFSYERFMENQLRKRFGFAGTPLRFIWRKTKKKGS